MKKLTSLLVAGAVLAGGLLAAAPAEAARCRVSGNSADDSSYRCRANSEAKLKFDVDSTSNLTTNSKVVANSGNNSVSAKEDINTADITPSGATASSVTDVDNNNLLLEYLAPDAGGDAEATIQNNDADDSTYNVKAKDKTDELVKDKTTANSTLNETVKANSGGNSASATDDANDVTINPSTASASSTRTVRHNWRTISRI